MQSNLIPRKLYRTSMWMLALVLFLWVAFALRVTQLDRLPLWWDEGLTVYYAHQSLPGLIREVLATQDADPPVYRVAMGGWKMFVGSSPFAMRFASVSAGLMIVAFTWTIGRWLTNKSSALLAVLFLALAPMQVYYAREAKGYAFAAACALLSTYAWGRKLGYLNIEPPLRDARVHWWVIYVLSTVASVGTHYYLGLLVLWQGLWVVGAAGMAWVRTLSRGRILLRLGRWSLAAGAMTLLLATWSLTVFSTTVRGVTAVSHHSALSLWDYVIRVSSEFSAGQGAEGAIALFASCGLAILVLAGALTSEKRAFLLTWFAVVLGGAYLMQAAYSFFSPRFLLFLGAVWYILAGRGGVALGRRFSTRVTIASAVIVAGFSIPGLTHIYSRPVDEAEDPRPVTAQVRSWARPGDAMLTAYAWQDGYFTSYVPDLLTFYRNAYKAKTAPQLLEGIFAAHDRLWVVNYLADVHDTYSALNAWLSRNAACAFDEWYGNTQLALFVRASEPPVAWPAHAAFERGIRLDYTLPATSLQPGDVLSLDLRWQATAPLERAYKVFVHLRQPDGAPIAQSDSEPAGGFEPTSTWQPGRLVIDRRALLVPLGAPPGVYTIYVGVYDPESQFRLSVLSPSDCDTSDSVCVGRVEIAGPAQP
jgi:hypothetical protein